MDEQQRIKLRRFSYTKLTYRGAWGDERSWIIQFYKDKQAFQIQFEKDGATSTTYITEAEVNQWIDKGIAIPIPAIGLPPIMGLDGSTEIFEYHSGFIDIKLKWWDTGPKEWKSFIAWYHDFWAWLQSELDKANPPEDEIR